MHYLKKLLNIVVAWMRKLITIICHPHIFSLKYLSCKGIYKFNSRASFYPQLFAVYMSVYVIQYLLVTLFYLKIYNALISL